MRHGLVEERKQGREKEARGMRALREKYMGGGGGNERTRDGGKGGALCVRKHPSGVERT